MGHKSEVYMPPVMSYMVMNMLITHAAYSSRVIVTFNQYTTNICAYNISKTAAAAMLHGIDELVTQC